MSSVKTVGSKVFWVVTFSALFASLGLTGCSSSNSSERSATGHPSSGSISKFFDPVATPLGMNFISNAYAAGTTGVKSPKNGLLEGDSVVISGTTNYNGTYTAHICPAPSPDTFCIDHPFVGDDATGTWQKTASAVAGACGSANGTAVATAPAANLCTTTATTPTVTGAGPFNWTCTGSNGGADASCSAPLLLDGTCGSANGTPIASAPSGATLCTTGTSTAVTGAGPFTWDCTGINGGLTSHCTTAAVPINGACGSANGTTTATAPASSLCLAGTASPVADTGGGGYGPFTWTCAGINSGSTSPTCSTNAPAPVLGVCGSANGTLVNADPASGSLCSVGTPSTVATNLDPTGTKSWSCTGQYGGAPASCSADYCYTKVIAGADPSPITLPNSAGVVSRFSGVAPLSVFFDATGTTATTTAQPFQDLEYRWNFGDNDTATWSYGSHVGGVSDLAKKNRAMGAVAAHVFETPGTYPVALTVTDGTNTVANSNKCAQIVVQNPDTIYAGTSTRCYSKTGAFTGCPAGATQVTDASGDFRAAIAADLATGHRLLFNRGETWFTSTAAIMNKDGPWTIGAYGTGAKPIVQWNGGTASAGAAMLGFAANGSNSFKDARIMDLTLDGDVALTTSLHIAVDFYGKFDQITFLRDDITNVAGGIIQSLQKPSLTGAWDQFTVQDSSIGPIYNGASGGNGLYLSSSRSAAIGNLIDNNSGGEHNFRNMYTNKLVAEHNTLKHPSATKANVTIRGSEWSVASGPIPAGQYNQYAVISDNEFIGAAGVTVPVNTSIDASHEVRTRYIIFERNWWHDQPAATTFLSLDSSYSSIRNNIVDMSAGAGGQAITITNNSDTGIAANNTIYNNTVYANQAGAFQLRCIRMFSGSSNTIVKNNLCYTPSGSGTSIAIDDAGSGTISSNNSSTAQMTGTIPGFANGSGLFNATTDFQIGCTVSYPCAQGASVPVWSDFFGITEPGTRDLGAVVH